MGPPSCWTSLSPHPSEGSSKGRPHQPEEEVGGPRILSLPLGLVLPPFRVREG